LLDQEYELMYRLENSHWWFLAKKGYIKTILDLYLTKRENKILDIGCGTGGMMDMLKEYGSVFGLDRHEAACAFTRRRNHFPPIKGDANQLPFKKKTFDLIVLLDVLYHQYIIDDKEVLNQVYELLAPKGFLLITDSAFAFLKSTHDVAVMARHRYTLREMTAKLKTAHFSIEKKSYLYFTLFPIILLSRLIGKISLRFSKTDIHSDLKETNPTINQWLNLILRWEGRFLRISRFPWGSTLLILGQKR
jgi:SAM-dependent methyltransferase